MNHGGLGRDVVVVVAAASVSPRLVLIRRREERRGKAAQAGGVRAERRDAKFREGRSRILRARLRAYRIRTPSIIKKESDSRSSKADPGRRAPQPAQTTGIF